MVKFGDGVSIFYDQPEEEEEEEMVGDLEDVNIICKKNCNFKDQKQYVSHIVYKKTKLFFCSIII